MSMPAVHPVPNARFGQEHCKKQNGCYSKKDNAELNIGTLLING